MWKLQDQIRRSLPSVAFIFDEHLVAKSLAAGIESHCEVLWLMALKELHHEAYEAIRRVGGKTYGVNRWRQSEKSSINIRAAVYEKKPGWPTGHERCASRDVQNKRRLN
jgi:hypothetical protein